MKKILLASLAALAFAYGASVYFISHVSKSVSEQVVGSTDNALFTQASTTRYDLSAGTAQQILSTSTSRVWTRIVTTSTGVYIKYNGATATVANSEPLSSPVVFDQSHLYTGTISVISPAAATVSVTDFSY